MAALCVCIYPNRGERSLRSRKALLSCWKAGLSCSWAKMDESPPTAGSLHAKSSEPFLCWMNDLVLSLSLHHAVALVGKVETLARFSQIKFTLRLSFCSLWPLPTPVEKYFFLDPGHCVLSAWLAGTASLGTGPLLQTRTVFPAASDGNTSLHLILVLSLVMCSGI